MNLYNLHDNPEQLHKHKEAFDTVPALIWDKFRDDPAELKKREDAIAKDAKYSLAYATHILQGPFPKGEEAISKDAQCSIDYARYVLEDPFPKGEAAISKVAHFAYSYARDILQGPFPKGEDTIKKYEEYYELYKELLNKS